MGVQASGMEADSAKSSLQIIIEARIGILAMPFCLPEGLPG